MWKYINAMRVNSDNGAVLKIKVAVSLNMFKAEKGEEIRKL